MAAPVCSIVIPTFNRRATVLRCIDRLGRQDLGAQNLQVIVVDDGSSDGTSEALDGLSHGFAELVVERQTNHGPGVARNRGLDLASAPVVLFINDDALLEPTAISAHLDTHRRHPASMVLGTFEFVPDYASTALGHMLTVTPHLFSYPLFVHDDALSADLAATCNLSVALDVARETRFDPRFTFAAEDVDFALRVEARGYVLRHNAYARALHDHHLTVPGLKRMALARGLGAARLGLKRGVHPKMLSDTRRAMVSESSLRHTLDASASKLAEHLVRAEEGEPLQDQAYVALAGVFRIGNLLGYLDEPSLIQRASLEQLQASLEHSPAAPALR